MTNFFANSDQRQIVHLGEKRSDGFTVTYTVYMPVNIHSGRIRVKSVDNRAHFCQLISYFVRRLGGLTQFDQFVFGSPVFQFLVNLNFDSVGNFILAE